MFSRLMTQINEAAHIIVDTYLDFQLWRGVVALINAIIEHSL
jgi:hypothetical protein